MMIVNERNCSGNLAVRYFLLMLNEVIANHVTDCQRPIFISFLSDHSVQFFEQRAAQRNSKTCNLIFAHGARVMSSGSPRSHYACPITKFSRAVSTTTLLTWLNLLISVMRSI